MADPKHIERLLKSVNEWNQWRQDYPEIQPDLTKADLSNVFLGGADLSSAVLFGTDLTKTDLSSVNLRSAHLSGADLSRTNLSRADLSGAYLYRANLCGAFLREVNLSRADLSGADLIQTNLSRADLSRVYFGGANLSEANLSEANLSEANLSEANLSEANLSEANLSEANLSEANLSNANLSGTNLSDAHLWYTVFAENDLSTVKGLVKINHRGRSYISLDTVTLPQDGGALHFLRGVGVPDEWIDFYRSTMMNPIQYYSCFISYSSSDEMLARRLHADLQDQGVRCWFAPHDMQPGQFIRECIDRAIHVQDKLLLILSKGSVRSGWVRLEVETALAREIRQQREVLFPIRIDDAVFQSTTNWATSLIHQRHIGDFRQWADPEHYQKVFKRLLRDLKAKT